LHDYAPGAATELYRLADISSAIVDDTGVFLHAMPYPAGFYNDPRMPLMYAIRAEGIDLSRSRPPPISKRFNPGAAERGNPGGARGATLQELAHSYNGGVPAIRHAARSAA
jgi:hypothetical protein